MNKEMIDKGKYPESVIKYAKKENFSDLLPIENKKIVYNSMYPFYLKDAYLSELDDLVRLHQLVRKRKAFTVLEFGSGYSTVVLADAIAKNKKDFEKLKKKPDIRNTVKFQVISIETSSKWLQVVKKYLPKHLKKFVKYHQSNVHISTFNDRLCHYYDKLPNIIPDFIYVDGPYQLSVNGSKNGLNFRISDRTPNMADLLLMEPSFLPGTFMVFDGRTNNARFIKNNLQRKWKYKHNFKDDIHYFDLIEPPLGRFNKTQLEYCLGRSTNVF